MSDWTINVTGLSCDRCAETVSEQLRTVSGVTDVDVDEHAGGVSTVRISADQAIDDAVLQDALSKGGAFTIVAG